MVHIKQAADAVVPGYAPPDFTGQLEGQFAAPKEQVVEALKASVENELKTGYAYMVYGNTLRDMSHHSVAEEFAAHASDEAEHADFLLRRLAVLAGAVDLPAIPPPPTLTDPMQIIQTMVRIEQEGIAKWRVLRALVGDEHPMRFKIEEYMTKELEHLDEVVQLLPPQIQLGGSQPPKLASWDRPIDIGVREKTAGVPPVFFKRAAEGIPQTGIPLQLSPMASGTLASMAGGNPGGNAPVPATGDDPAQEQEQAALPPTVSPEDIDPEVLLHLQQEQAGQAQEDQAASSYYAQQAEASRQQAQQFEQQLQQQAQQAQQLQQQLQQAQAQLQQTQQMAQSSSEMASQALGTQLQMQQVALQSRQQAVEALQNADGLRQQIRELVDPAPAPMPGANPDPIGQATGQLPQQAPQQQQAQQEAPKTASVLGSVGAIGTDILRDIQMGRGLTQVALPAGAALANAAWNLRDGRPQRDEQAVAAARSRLATAEGDYAQNRSYSNAVKLVAAKGMVASAELAKDHPKAVEATKALGTFTLVRGGSMAANNIAAKVKLMTEAARKGARPNPHA